jgi:hypothetical protein
MQAVNLRSFKQKIRYHKKTFKKYLGKLEKNPPKNLDTIAADIDKKCGRKLIV